MKLRILNTGLRSLTLVIKFVFILAIASYLTLDDVGLFGLIFVTVNMGLYFVGFEFYTYSTRDLLARPKSEWARLLTSQLVFFIILYTVVLPLSLSLFYFGFLPWWMAGWFVVLLVSEHLAQEITRLMIAMEKQIIASSIQFVRQALWAILFILFIMFYPEARRLEILIMFWLAGSIISILIGLVPLSKLNWKGAICCVDWAWVKRGIPIAFPIFLSSVALKGIFTVDRYVFEAFNSIELLGVYSVYIGIASAILSFMEAGVFVFYYPKMIRAFRSGDMPMYLELFDELRKQVLIWLLVFSTSALVLGPIVFWFIPDNIYFKNWSLFSLMVVAISIYIISCIYHYGLFAANRDRMIVFSNVIGFLVFCIVAHLLADILNFWSVTFSMIISFVIIATFKCFSLRRLHKKIRSE